MGYKNGNGKSAVSAGKKGSPGSKAKPFGSDYRYVNYTPSQQDKQRIKQYDFSRVDIFGWADGLLPDGYKLSLSAKWEGEPGESPLTFTASLTATAPDNPNSGNILTSRGGDAITAFKWLYYLHEVVFEGVWMQDVMSSWDLD